MLVTTKSVTKFEKYPEYFNIKLQISDTLEFELLCNESTRMINATKLIKQCGYDDNILNSWRKNISTFKLIDTYCVMRYNQPYYFYNGKSIWKEWSDKSYNFTIMTPVDDCVNEKSMIKKSLIITNPNVNIMTNPLTTGPNDFRGVYIIYDLIPEILRLLSYEYRVIANNFESRIIPILNMKNTNLSKEIHNYDKLLQSIKCKIDSITTDPLKKGHEAELIMLEIFQENGFPNMTKSTKRAMDLVERELNLYVEIKNKNTINKKDRGKFYRDALATNATLSVMIDCNPNPSLNFEFKQRPARLYLSWNHLNVDTFNLIRNTVVNINHQEENDIEMKEFIDNMPLPQRVDEAIFEKLNNILNDMITKMSARVQCEDYLDKSLINLDVTLVNLLSKNKPTALFVKYNMEQFMKGYWTVRIYNDFVQFCLDKKLPNLPEQKFRTIMKAICGKPRNTDKHPETGEKYHTTIYVIQHDAIEAINRAFPNIDEAIDKVLIEKNKSLEEQKSKEKEIYETKKEIVGDFINANKSKFENGYGVDNINIQFRKFVEKGGYDINFVITPNDLSSILKNEYCDSFMDPQTKTRKTKYVLWNSDLCNALHEDLKTFKKNHKGYDYKTYFEFMKNNNAYCFSNEIYNKYI